MIYYNNDILRAMLKRGGAAAHQAYLEERQFAFDTGEFEKAHAEVQHQHPHLSPEESVARAAFRLLTSSAAKDPLTGDFSLGAVTSAGPPPSHPRRGERRLTPLKIAWAIAILILLAVIAGLLLSALPARAEPAPPANAVSRDAQIRALLLRPPALAQFSGVQPVNLVLINGAQPHLTGTSLDVNCVSGCGAASTFTDNSLFTVGTTAINPIGGYYTTGADPSISSGNAGRARIDSHSYLFVDCVVGCSGGSTTPADALANPTTAGLQFDLLAGFNGTTWDRLRVDASKNLQVDVNAVGGTAIDTNSGVKSAGTQRVVLATDQPSLTNPQPANVTQISGTPISTAASGTPLVGVTGHAGGNVDAVGQNVAAPPNWMSVGCNFYTAPTTVTNTNGSPCQMDNAGNLRVNIAAQTLGKVLVTPDSVALPANQSVNLSQVAGATTSTAASGTQLVGIIGHAGANVDGATGAAPPANAIYPAGLGSGLTGGALIGLPVGDIYKDINISTATTTLLVTGVGGRQVRISALHMIAAGADNVAPIEGTGATCGTGTAGMAGGITAASGYNFAANGGIALGSGLGTVMQTVTAGDSVCLVTSAAVQLSGGLQYTIY